MSCNRYENVCSGIALETNNVFILPLQYVGSIDLIISNPLGKIMNSMYEQQGNINVQISLDMYFITELSFSEHSCRL